MSETKIEHAATPPGEKAEPWKLYIVMKNGVPFKAFIFEDDAVECIDRGQTVSPSDVFTTATLSGDAAPFDPPPGAVYKMDGVEYINTVGASLPLSGIDDIEVYKAYA